MPLPSTSKPRLDFCHRCLQPWIGSLDVDDGESLLLGELSREAVFIFGIRETSLLPGHVINPSLLALQAALALFLDAYLDLLGSQVEPAEGIADSADLVGDAGLGSIAYLLI